MKKDFVEICITRDLSLAEVGALIDHPARHISISREARMSVEKCHRYVTGKIKSGKEVVYGINTGFGNFKNKTIDKNKLRQLQLNLIRSHACGAGREVAHEIVRLMLLLKVKPLCMGHSGVAPATVDRIVQFYNAGIVPVVYEQGSLGASGDLAPLAHLFLPLIGEGEVWFEGRKMSGAEINKKMGWKPITLGPKEGLALLNGTQFMLAHATYILHHARRLSRTADVATALSVEGFNGRADAFDPLIHRIRPHTGQMECAQHIFELLGGEKAVARKRKDVQDPYAFRCVPQVHGATRDALDHAARVIQTEINSVSDNPLIFPDEDRLISGGNFHGQPLALVLDFMCMAIAELGSISERRIYQLLEGKNGLPLFLISEEKAGLNSGYMIPQYTAASIVSLNKQLCSPAVVDSIPSSNGQEDHVSMGANAAVKCLQVLNNVMTVIGIEWMNASQAISLRPGARLLNPALKKALDSYRKKVRPLAGDRYLAPDIEASRQFVADYNG